VIRNVSEEEFLAHYGILRKSGRYPWGSGETQSARNASFLQTIKELEKSGMKQKDIAEGYGMTMNQLRALKSIAGNEQRRDRIRTAERLKEKGMSTSDIGRQMGINESTVRSLLSPSAKDKVNVLEETADMLRRQVEEKEILDIGAQAERDLPIGGTNIGIPATKFNTAVAMLQEEGYGVHNVPILQQGTGKNTQVRVLVKPGVTQKEAWMNRENIRSISEHTEDGGRSYLGVKDPLSINSKRVGITYAEDGGTHADGVIFVRPGVKDVSIGDAHYAQVRIMVDGSHYLKGMAVYKDDLPDGVDLMFNTNKSNTGNKLDAMKKIKDDPDNPFGSVIRQRMDEHGNVISAMNIVGSKEGAGEEGGWDTWGKSLPAQMLSKQHPDLAEAQLKVTRENRLKEYNDIKALTNPTVRKKLLEDFADETDSSAVHLEAANMPRQATKVLLPVSSMKPTEIYAQGFHDGERVALVRFPHGGTFEIPQLTVNNRVPEAKKLLGTSLKSDAVGIHHSVAERLSGADFDGDTVLVIPNNQGRIKSTPALEGLKGFDPKGEYGPYDGLRTIDGGVYNAKKKEPVFENGDKPNPNRKGQEMGNITNLIADMTIRGANDDEMARAIRHSMVVIDAEKHHLDFKASAKNNGIKALKTKYQGKATAGASTLITRSTAETRVNERKQGYRIDPETGRKVFRETGATYVDRKTGETKLKTTKSKKGAEATDAFSLVSDARTPIELVYAEHANSMKALANEARKEILSTESIPYSPSAKKVYADQVASLDSKLDIALRNAPRERRAQVLAGKTVRAKRQANPDMDAATEKKISNQALNESRLRTGASKTRVDITQDEWDAIQAGAISNNQLSKILLNADMDTVRKYAIPHPPTVMTSAKQARAKQMLAGGYTQAEVANALGVKLSTLKSSMAGGE